MSALTPDTVARRAFDAWNAHDLGAYAALVAPTYISESDTLPAPARGPEGARAMLDGYVRAFPDIRLEIEQLLTSGDYVIVRWKSSGTHRGELMGLAATNRHSEGHGCTILEVRDG